MKIEKGIMVALGYGKYFRSDSIIGLEPIEEGRGPGKRTHVCIEDLDEPIGDHYKPGARCVKQHDQFSSPLVSWMDTNGRKCPANHHSALSFLPVTANVLHAVSSASAAS